MQAAKGTRSTRDFRLNRTKLHLASGRTVYDEVSLVERAWIDHLATAVFQENLLSTLGENELEVRDPMTMWGVRNIQDQGEEPAVGRVRVHVNEEGCIGWMVWEKLDEELFWPSTGEKSRQIPTNALGSSVRTGWMACLARRASISSRKRQISCRPTRSLDRLARMMMNDEW